MRKKKEVLEENVSGVTAETVAKEAVISRENFSEYDHKKIDKDIKYRAPLSYRYLRVIGWIGMAIMFISLLDNLLILSISFSLYPKVTSFESIFFFSFCLM